jgi:hypothetical protein
MTGSLLQLVSIGIQDKEFIGNPQISYFKSNYKQHTNFAIESIPLQFQEECDFGKKSVCNITKKGDLLNKLVLEIELPELNTPSISWINNIGNFIIEYVEISIGGFPIDKHYGSYMDAYSEVNMSESIKKGYKEMVYKNNFYTNISQSGSLKLYIPLFFWFCNNIGNSLPLVALQYHDVTLTVKFRDFNQCIFSGENISDISNLTDLHFKNTMLFGDFIFLDNKERASFAKSEHQYLIEQVQYSNFNNVVTNKSIINIDLHFNLPVKEMIWYIQNTSVEEKNDWSNYSNTPHQLLGLNENQEILEEATIYINGQERFYPRSGKYFRLIQPYNHHTSIPENFIYFYSFSLYPEKHQPSGSINFSRIDNSRLSLKCVNNINTSNVYIFAINYNLLIIKSGMGGLKFST